MKKISMIVPCFNEQEVIQKTYGRLRELSLPGYEKEILFVDDGSRDRTPDGDQPEHGLLMEKAR